MPQPWQAIAQRFCSIHIFHTKDIPYLWLPEIWQKSPYLSLLSPVYPRFDTQSLSFYISELCTYSLYMPFYHWYYDKLALQKKLTPPEPAKVSPSNTRYAICESSIRAFLYSNFICYKSPLFSYRCLQYITLSQHNLFKSQKIGKYVKKILHTP